MLIIPSNLIKTLRCLHKHVCKMNQAYLRHLQDSDKFELTFQYVDPSARVNRQFNFCRQATETIASFTQRVATNIEKVVKKKNKNQSAPVEVSVSLDGLPVDETFLCGDIFSGSTSKVGLHVCGTEYKVIVNSPWISGVTLPTSILAGFPVYPSKWDTVYTKTQLSEFCWYKSEKKDAWELIGSGFIYKSKVSDIGNFLKISCVPKNDVAEGPAAEAVSSTQVQAGPGFCPFETRHQFTQHHCENETFRVVSYNILADLYCDQDFTREVLHPYCAPYALGIDYRKQLFIKEIMGYNADIICLQEVDRKVYNYDLHLLFEQLDYGSNFCVKRGLVPEGVALFFNRKRFKHSEAQRLVLADEFETNPLFSDLWTVVSENEQLRGRILDRSTVLQVNVLESLTNDEVLVVGNTHLYFHPDADHIRLFQGAAIIKYLQHVLEGVKTRFQKRVSLILCGDFNSVPSCGIYQLYTSGSVQESHIDFQSRPEEAVRMSLNQPLRLKSACGTPKYTNFTAGFADCLDYIFCEDQNFNVEQVVPFPTLEELTQYTALPSIVAPSDHIALIADLSWRKNEK